MKKALLFILYSFFTGLSCSAQFTELNTLKASLNTIQDSSRYVDAINRIAMLLYEKNVDSTFYYTVKAREIANRLSYKKGKADATNNLGVFFDIKGNLQLALRYYNEAYISYVQLKDSSNTVQSTMNIAMVYKALGKDKRALQHYNAAFNLGQRLHKDSILSLVIYNYLLQFPEKFSQKISYAYINKAKKIAIKYKDERTLIAIEQLIADEMINNGKREEGLALLKKTIDAALEKKLYYTSMDMLLYLGDKQIATDSSIAVNYYQQGLTIANNNSYLIYSKLFNRKLFDFYSSNNNTIKAIEYAKQIARVFDQQEEVNNGSSIDYIDYALKDQQVNSLILRSHYQIAMMLLLIIACALAILATISIRKNLKRIKRLNSLTNQQNISMKKTLQALEQSQADNTRMMKIAAHDLRSPIGAIYSLASMMIIEPERSEPDKEVLELIKTSGKNSLELVNELLEVQFKTEDLKKERIDISEILQYCITLLHSKAEEKNQQLHLKSYEFTLVASREKLWRLISNLIANAIKFSPVGSSIYVNMENSANSVQISVADSGIGIPSEMQDKIFDMFTEAKRPGTEGEQPYGLGLAISKQIVEAHGGKIWFESNLNKGTTFYVSLPKET